MIISCLADSDVLDLRTSDTKKRSAEDGSNDIRLVQLGVVAWGIGCGRAGLPSVYSSVASARCWLDQVMSCYQPTDELDLRT